MKRKTIALIVVLLFLMSGPIIAMAKAAPVKIDIMHKIETHTNTADGNLGYSPETMSFTMFMVNKTIRDDTIGSLLLITKYSFDDGDFTSYVGGLNFAKIFSPKSILSLGYFHVENEQRGTFGITPESDSSRFTLTYIRNLNPGQDKPVLYSLLTTFGGSSIFEGEPAVMEKIKVTFPSDFITSSMSYTYSYDLDRHEHTTNQYDFLFTYKMSTTNTLSLGFRHVNQLFLNNPGDDNIYYLSLKRKVQ